MATFFERLELIVDANVAGAVKGLGLTSTQAAGLEKRTKSLGQAMPYVAAGAVAIGAGLWASVKAYGESERATLKLQNSLRNNPKLAGESADAFLRQASAIQSNTIVADEQVVSAQAMLATFRMTKSEIMGLTPLVVDYARKFDTDLDSAAKQVGKAMDGQVGALKRNGVTIDETMFKTDRYRAVMEALRGQVGGFAEGEANTAEGKIAQLGNRLNDIMEIIGAGVAPAVEFLADGLGDVVGVVQDATGWFGGLEKAVELYYKALISPAALALDVADSLFGDNSQENLQKTASFYDGFGPSMGGMAQGVRDLAGSEREGAGAADGHSAAQQRQAAAVQDAMDKIKAKTAAVWASIDADMAARGASLSAQEAQARYNEVISDPKSSPLERARAEFQLEQSFYASAKAAGEAAAQNVKGGSESEKAKASTEAQIASLTFLAGTLAPGSALRTNLEQHIAALQRTAGNFSSTIFANTEPARLALESLIAQYAGRQINFGVGVVTGAGIAASRGYQVNLDGSITPRTARGGVFSSPQTRVIGEAGPEAVVPLNKPNRAMQVMAEAGLLGAGGGGSRVYNVNVSVPLGADAASVGREIRFALDAYDRRIGRNN